MHTSTIYTYMQLGTMWNILCGGERSGDRAKNVRKGSQGLQVSGGKTTWFSFLHLKKGEHYFTHSGGFSRIDY